MAAEANKALARRVMERLDQRDLDGVLAVCAPDAAFHGFTSQPLGADGYKRTVSLFLAAFPDSRVSIDDLLAEGDKVAVRYTFRGSLRGELRGIAPTGKQVTVPSIVIFRVAGGKIAETWLAADFLGMLQQLAPIPPLGSAGSRAI